MIIRISEAITACCITMVALKDADKPRRSEMAVLNGAYCVLKCPPKHRVMKSIQWCCASNTVPNSWWWRCIAQDQLFECPIAVAASSLQSTWTFGGIIHFLYLIDDCKVGICTGSQPTNGTCRTATQSPSQHLLFHRCCALRWPSCSPSRHTCFLRVDLPHWRLNISPSINGRGLAIRQPFLGRYYRAPYNVRLISNIGCFHKVCSIRIHFQDAGSWGRCRVQDEIVKFRDLLI
jgi:hypothetical protein